MEEYFKQNLVKPRMMRGVLNCTIHNFSYKGHKPLSRNKPDVWQHISISLVLWSRRRHDRMIVGFTTTYTIGAYHH